jgi:hypothetical protein
MRHVNVTTVMMVLYTRLRQESKHQIAAHHHRAQLTQMRVDQMHTN